MQFIAFYSPAEPPVPGTPPDPKHMQDLMRYMTEATAKGLLVGNGGIMRAALGGQAVLAGGKYSTREGADQVLEARVVGFAILQAPSKEILMKEMETFLRVSGEGTVDVFPLMGPPPQK